jgi:predicted TIM-barrel fold metal-dependent hydrolase
MIIDTHLHLIDRSALSYPWLGDTPALNRDFGHALYATEARRLGIEGALHMEVDVADADVDRETDWVKNQAGEAGSLLRGAIAACRPESESFAALLEKRQADPFVRGFRRVLHVVPDAVSQSTVFRDNIRRLGGTGLPFDIVMAARQLPLAMELVDAAPDTQFVLDHCGVPDIAGGGLDPWRANVTALSERPNLVAKISGVVAYAEPGSWTVASLRPFVEHVIKAFGWDRVVWGSDWPVCTLGGGLSTWVGATHALVRGASAAEKEKLFAGNARQVWRLA